MQIDQEGEISSMIKIKTDFRVLMAHAAAVGAAKKSGDPLRIENAVKEHDAYKELCLNADEMALGITWGQLDNPVAYPRVS